MTTTDPRIAQLHEMQSKQTELNEVIGERTDGIDILSLICIVAPELDMDYDEFLNTRLYGEILGTQSNSERTDSLVREWIALDDAISNLDDDITLGE